ncbi:hypothetical protein BH09PSE3_BH09PSE3_26700 [soil metagenome]
MTQTLGQFAMSVVDLRRTHQWYQDVLGFLPAGGTEDFRGPAAETVMGVPGAETSCWWLIDRQSQFQLELFQFKQPAVRPKPVDWRPCDIGYTMIGIHVRDFDAVLARAEQAGSPALTAPLGSLGDRRVCLRDPEGMLIEVMERDIRAPFPRERPREELGVVTRFVTLSVPDLGASLAFFRDALGLVDAGEVTLHEPHHETLWHLTGAVRTSALLWADDMLVELVQYLDPVGAAWPAGYRISDQGPLNMAFVYRSKAELNKAFDHSCAAGAVPNHAHIYDFLDWGVMYVADPQQFSVELLFIKESFDGGLGFLPADPDLHVTVRAEIDAPLERIWDRISDHARIGDWWCYEGRLIEPGGDGGNGLGAIRELRNMGEFVVEQVVGWVPPFRLDYRATKGAPFDYHFARIELTQAENGGTRLDYTIRFFLPGDMADMVTDLVKARLHSAVDALKRVCETEGDVT